MLKGKVHINEQEERGNYSFAGVDPYMTCGFKEAFGDETQEVILTALFMILEKYSGHADYLQTFEYHYESGESTRFWCIHDGDHITFLLPDEY